MVKNKTSGILSGSRLFASPAMDSRIRSANVQNYDIGVYTDDRA